MHTLVSKASNDFGERLHLEFVKELVNPHDKNRKRNQCRLQRPTVRAGPIQQQSPPSRCHRQAALNARAYAAGDPAVGDVVAKLDR